MPRRRSFAANRANLLVIPCLGVFLADNFGSINSEESIKTFKIDGGEATANACVFERSKGVQHAKPNEARDRCKNQ
jgi:hypothetical protein